jgi:hypothetical protein
MATSDEDLLQAIREDRAQRAKEHRELLEALRAAGTASTITPKTAREKIRAGHAEAERRAAEAREAGVDHLSVQRARNGGEKGDGDDAA